ncbi:MAG: FAD-dependent oxidoreductase [Calditrichaeota bacterium]|nr:FAD-dependent oxidoreductase [Calditrichota bacterium]
MKAIDKTNINGVALRNRFFMAPVKTSMGLPGGKVTEDNIKFYEKIAKGGTAAIILEPMAVLPSGKEHPKQLSIHDDSFVGDIKKLVDTIHKNGAVAGIHLNHAGRAANPKVIGQTPLAPSKMVCPTTGTEAQEMTTEQIQEIVAGFGAATRRAVAAGADFIEIQFGHGYLVAQFFSERTNKRTDEYGGSLENRLRFAREVLDEVTKNKGNLPFIVRVSGQEFVDGGLVPEDLAPLFELSENYGASALHVGYGNACDNPPWYYNHMAMPEDEQFRVLKAIKEMTNLPLIAVGRMGFVPKIDKVLGEGLADYIALGRPLIVDPEFPNKMISGKEEEIILCGGCLEGCLRSVKKGEKIKCIVNPDFNMPKITPSEKSRKVMIVGGGIAGISGAIHLARKGHKVTIFEKSDHLGGQAEYAPTLSFLKQQLQRTIDSVKRQLRTVDVDVKLATEVTPELVEKENPDVLIVATGSRQNIPAIKNLETQYYLTSLNFFSDPSKVKGDRILIVGLGMIGLEAAAILANQNKEVVGVEPLPEAAANMEPITRKVLLMKLAKMKNVTLYTNTLVKGFADDAAIISRNGEEKQLAPFDTVIIAAGMKPMTDLAEKLQSCCNGEVYAIGDAHEVGDIKSAFTEGMELINKVK